MAEYRRAKKRVELSVGESVRIVRELQALSQNELAAVTGIPQSTISAIERDRVKLGVEAGENTRACLAGASRRARVSRLGGCARGKRLPDPFIRGRRLPLSGRDGHFGVAAVAPQPISEIVVCERLFRSEGLYPQARNTPEVIAVIGEHGQAVPERRCPDKQIHISRETARLSQAASVLSQTIDRFPHRNQ